MILAHGKLYENKEQGAIIASLKAAICETLNGPKLDTEEVILACDRLSKKAEGGAFDEIAKPLLEFAQVDYATYLDYCRMFSEKELRKKLDTELCGLSESETKISEHLFRERRPLGVLLHIAAGNVDALPAYSVIEGLLTGNINLLKLPSGDNGVSVRLLSELIAECPALKEYIYVFDVPSTEIETIKTLAGLSDGVVVWGGDAAVRAAHRFIEPNTKLIVWGHKLSFAYALPGCPDDMLCSLAADICKTNQLLCSSCQGIFVDTDDEEELRSFGERFFEILKKENQRYGKAPRGMRAKNTLKLYDDKLENRDTIFAGEGVSVVIRSDSELELSYLFRNVWIKALPHEKIISALKHQKGYLQSCALLIPDGDTKETVIESLKRTGLTRITGPSLSTMLFGEAHDGTFALREYSRIVDVYR